MKINDTSGSGVSGLGKAQELTSTGFSTKTKANRSGQDDEVSLSNLSNALSSLQTDSPHQAGRLTQLSASVASGSYQVDAYRLSGSIIQASIRA